MLGYASWLFADQLVRMAVGIVVSITLARYWGSEQFGFYNIFTASLTIASCLVPLAADAVVTRDLVANPQAANDILGSQAALRIVGVLASFVVFAILILFQQRSPFETLLMIAVAGGCLLFQPFDAVATWLNANFHARDTIAARLPAFLIASALRVLLVYMGFSVWVVLLTLPLEAALAAIGLVFSHLRIRRQPVLNWRVQKDRLSLLFVESWPLLIASVSVALYMRLDVLMLGALVGEHEVGIYSVATRLSEVWYVLATIIVASFQPLILRLHKEDRQAYLQCLRMLHTGLFWLSLCVAITLTLAAKPLVTMLFGTSYAEAAPVLAVHGWAAIPVFLGVASSQFLVAESFTRFSMYRTFAGLVTNVILNFVLIPLHGAMGAAIATVVSYTVAMFFPFLVPKLRNNLLQFFNVMNPLLLWNLPGFLSSISDESKMASAHANHKRPA